MIETILAYVCGAAAAYFVPRLIHHARHWRSQDRLDVKRVYVSAPFAGDVEANIEAAGAIARELAKFGKLPIAPHLILPAIIDEGTPRDRALCMCLSLIETCAEVRVYRNRGFTDGMRLEVDYAKSRGIPVVEVWGDR